MESGKALVLNAVAKMQRPFRASAVTEMTGLDRQLVRYHLKRFVERGWLENVGRTYSVINLGQIIDELTEVSEKEAGTAMPKASGFISSASAKNMNTLAQQIVYAKVMKAPMAIDMAVYTNQRIDHSIAYFKALKKFLNNSHPQPKTAAKHFMANTTLYEDMEEIDFRPSISREQWLEEVAERVEMELDES